MGWVWGISVGELLLLKKSVEEDSKMWFGHWEAKGVPRGALMTPRTCVSAGLSTGQGRSSDWEF